MRNFFVNYRGGAASRAGTCYIAITKQPGDAPPPRDIQFQFNINQGYALEFGDQYMRPKTSGAYIIESFEAISGATNANPLVLAITAHNYKQGDWISISGMQGLTNLNGLIWIVNTVIDANHVTLTDLFGQVVNSTSWGTYTSGGNAARIYTVVAPYAAEDLPYLKYTQSADTMTLTCVNTQTGTEYPPYDLTRFGQTDWVFTQNSFGATIQAPKNVTVTAQSSAAVSTWYSYMVTAVSATGEESIASSPGNVENNDISILAGSNTIAWSPVAGATSYNIYKATPSYNVQVPIGVLYGFAGTSLGTSFTDTNITADFTTVPPTHTDPFARGTIIDVNPVTGGSGYTQATIGFTVHSSTGSGFVGIPIVVSGGFVGFLIENGGANFNTGDTITITDSGGGSGAAATLTVGPSTGTYPGTVAYFQQRRAYANSLNNPNTYWMSKPGLFLNMDSSIPEVDDDAIQGSPWAQQINGIQWMVPMPGGLVIGTGAGAWQLTGGANAALTPADQDATPQAYNGFSAIVPPLTIVYDILYVQAKGSVVRDLSYNFFVNIYAGTDITVLSSHLFLNFTLLQWGWAEEPYKIVWAIRNDGTMLSFTYLKEQDVYAWARHDTQGLFSGVCVTTEGIGQCAMIQGSVPSNPGGTFPTSKYVWVSGSSCEALRFNPTDTGNTAPEINIQGVTTTLTGPEGSAASFTSGVTVSSKGLVYVYNSALQNSHSISGISYIPIFAAGATGNIAPIATISGSNTGLPQSNVGEPTAGICLDGNDNIYYSVGYIIYRLPAGSTGNALASIFAQDSSIGPRGFSSLCYDPIRNWIWASFEDVLSGVRAYSLDGIMQRDLQYANDVGGTPNQVSIGPDASIWYADSGIQAIYKFSPTANNHDTPMRSITGMPIPANGIYSIGIASDGNIFTGFDGPFGPDEGADSSVYQLAANASGPWSGITPITMLRGAATNLGFMIDGTETFPQQIFISPI